MIDRSHNSPGVATLLLCLLGSAIFLRAISLEGLEMLDPTEARYATVAQEMVLSGDWITPKIPSLSGYIPYLGKPPLHFWLTAVSFKIFGMDEWAARVPSFLALLAMLLSVYLFAERFLLSGSGVVAGLVTISSCLLFFFSGSSITDVTLGACVGVVILSFAQCIVANTQSRRVNWGLLVFLAAALGFLTKGPVAFVLAGLPIMIWCLVQRNLRSLLKLPWLGGISLLVLIVVPWFVAAEARNPGFIRYFFINENFGRYLVHEYGDRYGSGHEYPRGSVWWMMFVSFLPWSVMLFMSLPAAKREIWSVRMQDQRASWATYALLWGLSPAIFFSLVRQLHPAYVVPGIPGLALWVTYLLTASPPESRLSRLGENFVKYLSRIVPVLVIGLAIAAVYVSFRFHSAAWAMAPLAFVVLLNRVLKPKDKSLTLRVGSISASLVSIFVAANCIAGPYISESQSAESILQYVLDKSPEPHPVVAVIRARNYSPWYLERAAEVELGEKFNLIGLEPADLATSAPKNIILTANEYKLIPLDVLGSYVQENKIGNWIWMVRRTGAPK